MDFKALAQKASRTVYAVSSGQSGKNQGSGVSINTNGDLLTAAHVISKRANKSREHIENIRVRDEKTQTSTTEYEVMIPGLDVGMPHLASPILLDIGYVRPKKPPSKPRAFLELSEADIEVGTEVLMAGFPEDVILPLDFLRLLDKDDPIVQEKLDEVIESNRQLMVKSGIIGNASPFSFDASGGSISGQIFAVDNYMAKGASGGPVVNSIGQIIGIIIEGSEIVSYVEGGTEIEIPIPSGITYAISTRTIATIRDLLYR